VEEARGGLERLGRVFPEGEPSSGVLSYPAKEGGSLQESCLSGRRNRAFLEGAQSFPGRKTYLHLLGKGEASRETGGRVVRGQEQKFREEERGRFFPSERKALLLLGRRRKGFIIRRRERRIGESKT